MDVHDSDNRREPWYNSLNSAHPFELGVKVTSTDPTCSSTFRAVTCFPWNANSLEMLWNGEYATDPKKIAQWHRMLEKWTGVVVIGGGTRLRLILTRPNQPFLQLFTIAVPDDKADVACIAWCMVLIADEFVPLVAFSGNCILYVFDVDKGTFRGVMRGHGGKINDLVVHPREPHIMLSTSHDHTCRLYDLLKEVNCSIVNPHWPGKKHQSLGGPAFGLRSNDGEGIGRGRCFAVLAGGPSGGHHAPVLSAAFHPTFPIIATCGMDHAIKLWQTPIYKGEMISREDKPLFSSTRLHSAQVLSITWMNQDTLLSHSGPIITREEDSHKLNKLPGTLVLWRWLGLDRFFPPSRFPWHANLRGCASDFQESSSFKVIAEYNLPPPIEPVRLHTFQMQYITPLIAIPSHGLIRLSSIKHFKPRLPPLFPDTDDQVSEAMKRLNFEDHATLPCWGVDIGGEKNEGADEGDVDLSSPNLPKVEACAIGEDGRLLIGIGARDGIWIWRIPSGSQLRSAQHASTN